MNYTDFTTNPNAVSMPTEVVPTIIVLGVMIVIVIIILSVIKYRVTAYAWHTYHWDEPEYTSRARLHAYLIANGDREEALMSEFRPDPWLDKWIRVWNGVGYLSIALVVAFIVVLVGQMPMALYVDGVNADRLAEHQAAIMKRTYGVTFTADEVRDFKNPNDIYPIFTNADEVVRTASITTLGPIGDEYAQTEYRLLYIGDTEVHLQQRSTVLTGLDADDDGFVDVSLSDGAGDASD